MKSIKSLLSILLIGAAFTGCSAKNENVKEQLSNAKNNNQTAFIVVTNKNVSSKDLTKVVTEATTGKQVAIIQMNIDDKENAELVKEYRLAEAPMPLVMIFSDKGTLLGGMQGSDVTKENIAEAIPTPKYSEIISALTQQKPVFIVLSNSNFGNNSSAQNLCNTVQKEMITNAEVVVVDPDDENEAKLIKMLNVKTKLENSAIIAINAQGIMSGRFDTIPSKEELHAAATKIVQSGCAPGGCGPTCK